MDYVLLALGGVLLYFGADWLVAGASRLAFALRVSKLVVGLTIVAYATSSPELVVGIQAARSGLGDVALGNVIGSNIANIGLILGVAVLVRPAPVDASLRTRELPLLAATTVALPAILYDGRVATWEALALIATALGYSAWMVRAERARVAAEPAPPESVVAEASPRGRLLLLNALLAALGLAVLLAGGNVFVGAASSLARAWGMSERVLGLTIVAVGTSLPELAASVVAAVRGQSEIAVGNVVGSNIFNVLLCLGGAGLAGTIATSSGGLVIDLAVLAVFTILTLVFLRAARIMARWEGAVLLVGYVGYVAYLVAS